jgi:phosphogluconate dehydratase
VNGFHAAGGIAFLVRELLAGGLLHGDVNTVWGKGLAAYAREPVLIDGHLQWRDVPAQTGNRDILRPLSDPFTADGGLKVLEGNLGEGVIKVSSVKPEHQVIEAPARVFDDQDEFALAFKAGTMNHDLVAVIRFQGPGANGMPELHQLTPLLGSLQDKGFRVALVTDGRMSGASGKVPAAIHVTPAADQGGPLARVRDGDIIRVDAVTGELSVQVDAAEFAARAPAASSQARHQSGVGRELFAHFRDIVSTSDRGASVLFPGDP